jgi:CubicO group peptidase (beta-lactamase class C family)
VYHAALYETAGMAAMRPARGSHAPGTFWYYNNWDFNALGTIYEKHAGTGIFEAFQSRLAAPLQMQDFRRSDGEYFTGRASVHPAYPFRMTARDLARFGLLYLREGDWGGKRLVPAAWVRESVRTYSSAGGSGGYGYMWWTAVGGKHLPGVELPEGSYSAQGAGGHYVLVIPAYDVVIVHRVNTDIRGNQVNARQFGELVRLILDARLPPK